VIDAHFVPPVLESFSQVELDSPIFQEIRCSSDDTTEAAGGLWGGMSRAATALQELMPERDASEHVRQSKSLDQNRGNSKEVLELLLFLLSNNTPGVVYWSQRLDYFTLSLLRQKSVLQSSLKEMIASQQSSALALRDQLWAAALRVSDMPAVRELLKVGVDPNKPIALKYLSSRPIPTDESLQSSCTPRGTALPLQMAVYARDRDLADFLVAHGASWVEAMAKVSLLEFATFRPSSSPGLTSEFLDEILRHHSQDVTSEQWIQATQTFTRRGDVSSARLLLDFYRDSMLLTQNLRPEALIYAIRNRLDDLVHFFLEIGSDVNALDRVKKSALWEAVFVERTDICNLLLDKGATPQPERYDIPFPLQCAAYNGNMELVNLLISYGADINHLNLSDNCQVPHSWCITDRMYLGRTALEAALYGRQPRIALMLLECGADTLGSELMISIRQRLPSLVEHLLYAGIPLTDQPDDQESALEAAIVTNQVEIAQVILTLRPNLYEPSALCAATHMAMMTDDLSMIETLLERRLLYQSDFGQELSELEGTALAIAAFFGNLTIVNVLTSHGIKPPMCIFPSRMTLTSPQSILNSACEELDRSPIENWGEECGWWRSSHDADVYTTLISPLEAAIVGRDAGTLSLMLSEGYRIDEDSLSAAARIGYLEGLEMLLVNSPDMTQNQNNLRSAFYAAIQGCDVNIVQLFLRMGVDVNGELSGPDDPVRNSVYFQGSLHDYRPRTALQAAVGAGSPEVVDILLSHGADIHAPATGDAGATALQLAAMQGLLGIARKLLDRGASCNEDAPAPRGRAALEGAAEHGRLDMVQLLLSRGVETTGSHRIQFIRAIKYATRNAHHVVVDLLRNSRVWEDQDESLFRVECSEEPNALANTPAFHPGAPITIGNSKGKEKETMGLGGFTPAEVSQDPIERFSPQAIHDVTDGGFLPNLMADWSPEIGDDASSASVPSTSFHNETASAVSHAMNGESSSLYLRPMASSEEPDWKDGNWFHTFLQDFPEFQEFRGLVDF